MLHRTFSSALILVAIARPVIAAEIPESFGLMAHWTFDRDFARAVNNSTYAGTPHGGARTSIDRAAGVARVGKGAPRIASALRALLALTGQKEEAEKLWKLGLNVVRSGRISWRGKSNQAPMSDATKNDEESISTQRTRRPRRQWPTQPFFSALSACPEPLERAISELKHV